MGEALRFAASIVLVHWLVETVWRVVTPGASAVFLSIGVPAKVGAATLKTAVVFCIACLSAAFTLDAVTALPPMARLAPWLGGLVISMGALSSMSSLAQESKKASAADKRRWSLVSLGEILLYVALLHAPAVVINPATILAMKGLAWTLSLPILGLGLSLWALWRAFSMIFSAGLILLLVGFSSVAVFTAKSVREPA